MKKTLYTPLLTAALLLAASCANDPVEEVLNPSAPGTHLPGDTFIIDYAASTGEADTRADANQRIQSLDYLVYQSTDGGTTYTLLKRRAIPDINTDTQWPLTRKTMTWAQREALKDTLNTSCMYKMVFVANAADWIWEKENATPPTNDALENSSTIVLQHANLPMDGTEAPKFEDGRLILPPRVFTEKDMYYMETVEVDGKRYTEEKTAHQNVLLKRMINKVEVRLDASLVTTENVDEDIEAYLDSYLEEALQSGGDIYQNMRTAMSNLADKLTQTAGSPNAIANLKNYLKDDTPTNRLLGDGEDEPDPHNIRTTFVTTFKEYMKETELVTQKIKWNEVDHITIEFTTGEYAPSMNFSKQRVKNEESNEDPIKYKMDTKDQSFYFYSFGDYTLSDNLNNIQTIYFYNVDGYQIFSLSGTGIKESGKIGGNYSICVTCDPFQGINADKNASYEMTINFDTFIPWEDLKAYASLDIFKRNVENALGDLESVKVILPYPCNPAIVWKTSIVQ